MDKAELLSTIELLIKRMEELHATHTKEINELAYKKFDELAKKSLITLAETLTKLTHESFLGSERLAELSTQIEKYEENNAKFERFDKLLESFERVLAIFSENQRELVDLNAQLKKITRKPLSHTVI